MTNAPLINTSLQRGDPAPAAPETVSTVSDQSLLNEVISEMRQQLAADQRSELPPATLADGTPIADPQIAFFARMMQAPSPTSPIIDL
jgi:hypothetical protein